ncbi:aldo/keto reductase [Actinokineospora sp. NBRC 105648]|uniref:aldo/keto reductase n=1 Tax=Actinokineospora sp. NBRC 105648 TaxID=3032206 RepID=UPI0024A16C9F|nr:aldo/keto reductase [Actinokineospora sp. NBRC 105648]GLZ37311.1 aldo/keto reductase [Actinokineospora sp. NBRC 105648]
MPATDRLALGLAALGRPAYINLGRVDALPADRGVESLRSATESVLDAAYAAGVRRVDTARSYGRAEEFLAGWLDSRGHTDITVSSKWGYAYVGGWWLDAAVHESKEHSAARFHAQWARSRALLGDRIALYQVHSLTVDSPLFTDGALLDALADLAGSGQRLGFSTSGPAQADAVRRGLDIERAGVRVFTAVQSTWNALETSVGPALAEARAAGVLVAVKEALANGRLAVRPPAAVRDAATRLGVTPDAVALAHVLAQPWADVVLLGPASTAQLADNLAATGIEAPELAPDLADLADLAEDPGDYWATRSALPWT